DVLLAEGRNVDAVDGFGRREAERPHLATLDLGGELVVSRDADIEAAVEQTGDRLTTARVRDVVQPAGIGSGLVHQHAREQVVGAADRTTADRDRTGVRAPFLEQVVQGPDRRV